MSKQRGGRVHLEVQELFWEDNEDKFTELLLDVGHLAQILHLPIEWFHAQSLARYKRDIEEADNNIETWAAKLIVKVIPYNRVCVFPPGPSKHVSV